MLITPWLEAAINLFYPSLCHGCQTEAVNPQQMICPDCLHSLPYTGFEKINGHPVEQLFWGRTRIAFACSLFYYIEHTPLQNIIHQIKYQNETTLALRMGEMMGEKIDDIFKGVQYVQTGQGVSNILTIPMPMHPRKMRKRGYNQAALLCKGIEKATGIPCAENLVTKTKETSTQTKKSRTERWQNVESIFRVPDHRGVESKQIIIVDDVVTTGASAEALSNTLLEHGAASVGIYSLAFTI